ncbi:hypothetical protein AbraCBS73388_008065, partial [Aspergillus brasiliensis]
MWTLSGTVEDLYASTLAQFFDKDESVQAAVLPILESINVEYLNISYQYVKGSASSFDITGNLIIGSHKFTLIFKHNGAEDWSFVATAESKNNPQVKSTVGGLISSIAGEQIDLPEFVSDISVELSTGNAMNVVIEKSKSANNVPSMVILLTIRLGPFTVQYIQTRQVVPKALAAATPTQRILLASMNGLDTMEIPMVGKIPQPFDEVLFILVPKGKTATTAGLPMDEIEAVNQVLTDKKQPLVPYKVVKKGTPQPKDIVLRYGLHFMLMLKATNASSSVALDYVFNTKRSPQAYNEEPTAVSDNGSQTAPYERGVGPLSVKNIGFKYSTGTNGKESILGIRLDASAKIGPVEFALLGLTLGLNFKSDKGSFTLHKLPPVDVSLEGLQAGFQKPPIEIAG